MATGIPFITDLQFQYGVLEQVAPRVRRLIARNPGPFTHVGTGTYVVGERDVTVIDPGPDLPQHVDALLENLKGERVAQILITHTHLDHSPAARALKARTGAATYGFGPHGLGRYQRGESVEAGADLDFVPDVVLQDGDVVSGNDYSLQAVHTPGHCANHLCFQLREERTLFTGDHVMGWSTTVVSPPDGDMGDYLRSLSRLLTREDALYLPTHGAGIGDPKPFVAKYIEHRKQREQQILECLRSGVLRIIDMVPIIYVGTASYLYPAAARSVFAHLLDLSEHDLVVSDGPPTLDAEYRLR